MSHQRQGFTNGDRNWWSRQLDLSNPQDSFVATDDQLDNSTFQINVQNNDDLQNSIDRGTAFFHNFSSSSTTSTSNGNSRILSGPPTSSESASFQTKICESHLVHQKILAQSCYSDLYHQQTTLLIPSNIVKKRKPSFHSEKNQNPINLVQPTSDIQEIKTQFQANPDLSINQSFSSSSRQTQWIRYQQHKSYKEYQIMHINTNNRQQIYRKNTVQDTKIQLNNKQIPLQNFKKKKKIHEQILLDECVICKKQFDITYGRLIEQSIFICSQCSKQHAAKTTLKRINPKNKQQDIYSQKKFISDKEKIIKKYDKVQQEQVLIQKYANFQYKQGVLQQNQKSGQNSENHSSLTSQSDMFFEKEDLINSLQLSKIQHIEDSIGRSFDNQNSFQYDKSSFSHFLQNQQVIQSENEQPFINQSNPNIYKTITQNSDFLIEQTTTKTMKIKKKNSLLISEQTNTKNAQFYSTYEEIPFKLSKKIQFFNSNNTSKHLPLYNHPIKLCQNCMKTAIPQSSFFCDHCSQKIKINTSLSSKKISYNGNILDERGADNLLQMLLSFSSFSNVQSIRFNRNNLLTHQRLKDLHLKLTIIEDPLKIQHLKDWMTTLKITNLAQNSFKFPNLKAIDLGGNQITDAGLQVLTEHVQEFPNLKAISLSWNQITDAGLQMLAEHGQKFSNLEVIFLGGNQITDARLQVMAENGHKFPNLEVIGLQGSRITGAGMQVLAEHGQKFTNLKVIDLDGNKTRALSDRILNQLYLRFLA